MKVNKKLHVYLVIDFVDNRVLKVFCNEYSALKFKWRYLDQSESEKVDYNSVGIIKKSVDGALHFHTLSDSEVELYKVHK